jgi:dihydrofolate reductase
MLEITYYAATSLDGYVATPDGGLDWLKPFEASGEDYGYARFYASVDALLMGRKTYEVVQDFAQWPYAAKPSWVFARHALSRLHPDVLATSASPLEIVEQVEASGMRHAWLVGGGQLAAAFREAGLIDRVIVSVIPVLLGRGIPLFGAGGEARQLVLERVQHWPDGVVQIQYGLPR